MQTSFLKRILTLLIVSYAFFFFGNSLLSFTDPDEAFYALTAKEMIAHGDWLTPYIFNEPQFEKPILTYWLLKVAFNAWGITPFAARFFPALFATLGVIAVYLFGLLGFKDERKAFLSALILATSALFAGMGKTVFTDMIFTVFILYALLSFFWGFCFPRRRTRSIILFYIFAALATLTKGPLGLLIPGLVIILFLLYRRQLNVLSNAWLMVGLAIYLSMTLPWYLYMFHLHGSAFIQEFFYNDHWRRVIEAEHRSNDRWFFYPVTMIAGFFPWSLFVLGALVNLYKRLKWDAAEIEHWLLSWLVVVFILFQAAHSKLASYILPLFPALALLTGGFIGEQLLKEESRKRIRVYILVGCGVLAVLGTAVFASFRFYDKYLSSEIPVYFLSASLITIAGLSMTLAFKNRLQGALYLSSMVLLPMLWTAFMVRADIEPYISSYEACQYLPHRPAAPTVVMTSKPYARGVHFYTGQDIAVMDVNGENYFSPHPVPILNTDAMVLEFLTQQKTTYAVLKKGTYRHLTEIAKEDFKVDVLKQLGYNYVLRIDVLTGD